MLELSRLERRQLCQIYSIADPVWYRPPDSYKPDDSFVAPARDALPGWSITRSGLFYSAVAPSVQLADQGWKIHCSSVPATAKDVLRIVCRVCYSQDVPMKFAVDERILRWMNGKAWPRPASGKFVTVYPTTEQLFDELVARLYEELNGYNGPYVLSDRRYGSGGVVHYRYGGYRQRLVIDATGRRIPVVELPDGTVTHDERRPYFVEPGQPVGKGSSAAKRIRLGGGRYEVSKALKFSATGGVYLAADTVTGSRVVIREARPFVDVDSSGTDAVARLREEYRVLRLLDGRRVAPRALDYLTSGGHEFLVEEYVEGPLLHEYLMHRHPLLMIDPRPADFRRYREVCVALWRELLHAFSVLAEHGVGYPDLSPANVIVTNVDDTTARPCLIDFEGATVSDHQPPESSRSFGGTPGFRRVVWQDDVATLVPTAGVDGYSVGMLALSFLFPVTQLCELSPSMAERLLAVAAGDLGFDKPVLDVLRDLIALPPTAVPDFAELRSRLGAQAAATRSKPSETTTRWADLDLAGTVDRGVQAILATAQSDSSDYLYPGDPLAYETNAECMAYGAAGVLYALRRVGAQVPRRHVQWLLDRKLSSETHPPGLYSGLGGVAWALAELDEAEASVEVLRTAAAHPLRDARWDVFHGAAGLGLAMLHGYRVTGEEEFLTEAIHMGSSLADGVDTVDGEPVWVAEDGTVTEAGYGFGRSGIAMFLLCLHRQTGDARLFDLGERAVEADIGSAVRDERGLYSVPSTAGRLRPAVMPYWLAGTAGVLCAALRYWKYRPESRIRRSDLVRLGQDLRRRYAVMPGQFTGLAGIGEVLLDMHAILGESRWLDAARVVADGIRLFEIHRPDTVYYPGDQLLRLSADLGTGSAGVLLFLKRLQRTLAGQSAPASALLLGEFEPATGDRQ